MSKYKNTTRFVKTYGNQVEQEIEKRLASSGHEASGKLMQSIRYEVRETAKGVVLKFAMADHGKYIDKGITGAGVVPGFKGKVKKVNKGQYDPIDKRVHKFGKKMPPEKSVKRWMQIKGIPKEASFPIRRSIWMFGMEPTNFFTIPTTRRKKQLDSGIKANMILDIEAQIKKEFKKK